ncbi:MAG: PEP-CTERM sorting domain-containing protein [Phycisphaerae bacterium]|nr:PEP-CTERM sorting domain-containing protein [Phycisphaerae bacterium]
MYREILSASVALFLVVILAQRSNAGVTVVIFDNGGPVASAGDSVSDLAYAAGQQAADDFSLSSSANIITGLNWWGTNRSGPVPSSDNFTIRIYSSAGSVPALTHDYEFNLGHVQRGDTGMDSYGADVYAYSGSLPTPLSLTPSTTYWLSIMNNTSGTSGHWSWSRVNYTSGNGAARSAVDTIPWNSGLSHMAFQLVYVPEPGTISIMVLGGLAMLRRKP